MCAPHSSHRTEGNCYLCRAIESATADTEQDGDDE